MIDIDLIHSFFDYFSKKVYGLDRLYPTDTTIKHSESFLLMLDKAYGKKASGKDFLFRYFCFQFDYWYWKGLEKNISIYGRNIQLSFIIGKKAFDRFQKRNSEYDWRLDNLPFMEKCSIKKSDLVRDYAKVKTDSKVDTEAPIKLAMYNEPEGFLNCIDFSTMFNHKSHICQGCKFKKDCKKLLKKVHPTLYTDRGYE